MSKLNYEYNNGFISEQQLKQKNSNRDKLSNLNYVYIPSNSPIPFTNLNSVSSNTYSSYDPKLSSNNSKTSNVSSSNESSLINNSYHSNPQEEFNDTKYKPVYNKNLYDQRYISYVPKNEVKNLPSSSKRPIKIKNLPNEKPNDSVLRNKPNYKSNFNSLGKRHSVNIESFSPTPRSNINTPPVSDVKTSNDKLLSYEYYCNSNYDKKMKDKNFFTDKYGDSSYGSLSGTMNKERKAKSINNVASVIVANLDSVKSESVENNSQHESPLYKKIMSKLSEIPDSLLMRNSSPHDNASHISSTPILNHEHRSTPKTPLINSINHQSDTKNSKKTKGNVLYAKKSMPLNYNNSKPVENQKYVSLIEINPQDKNGLDKDKLANKENRRAKHKSMYIETNYEANKIQVQPTEDRSQNSDKLNSQAGDLIYSALPFYNSNLPHKASNQTYDINDYLYSDETSKIIDETINLDNSKLELGDGKKDDAYCMEHGYGYGNLKSNYLNVLQNNSMEDRTNSSHTTTKSRDSGIVTNKNGINAFIKIIDPKSNDNKMKRYSNVDDLGIIEKNSIYGGKKDSDSSYQSNNNSMLKELNLSTNTNLPDTLYDINTNCKSTESSNRDFAPISNSTYKTYYASTDFGLNDTVKSNDFSLNDKYTFLKNEKKCDKTSKELEEIEKATVFEQSSSFSESFSDVDSDLLENSIMHFGSIKRRFRKKRSKNYVLPMLDLENTAKIVSNYPVHTTPSKTVTDEIKPEIQPPKINLPSDDYSHKSKTRTKSKDFDPEITELTDKITSKNKENNIVVSTSFKVNKDSSNEGQSRIGLSTRKISTPPPLPHILDSKYKRNTIHGSGNLYMNKFESDKLSDQTKPVSITSAIRDGKLEKPIRVNHGLPPPPPILITRQSSYPNPSLSIHESSTKDTKTDDKIKQNTSNPKIDNLKCEQKRPQLIKNDHVMAKSNQKDVIIKNSKKDDSKNTATTNLPQLDKIDYVLKTNDDKLLTNILPYHDDRKLVNNKNKRDNKKTNKNGSYLNDYDDPWSSKEFKNGKNFYENYARENDRRKKEGNGFLMLLPGIAIPIDTDAADSDESN